jgi:hypothetical protein
MGRPSQPLLNDFTNRCREDSTDGALSLAPGRQQAIEDRINAEIERHVAEIAVRIEASIEEHVQELLANHGKFHAADKRVETFKSAVESLHGRIARIHELTIPDMVGEQSVSLLTAFAELRKYDMRMHYRVRKIEVALWPERYEGMEAGPADHPSLPVQAKLG